MFRHRGVGGPGAGRRRRTVLALLAATTLAAAWGAGALAPASAANAAVFNVGAAAADITPTFYRLGDAPVPAGCAGGSATWTGKRYFAFEDAYIPNPTVHAASGAPMDEYALGDVFCKIDPAPFFNPEYGHAVVPTARYEGIYLAGGDGLNRMAKSLAGAPFGGGPIGDGISARAIYVENGGHRTVLVVVDSIGTFNSDFDRVRHRVAADIPALAGIPIMFASTHNESAPDPIGIWGVDNPAAGGTQTLTGVNHLYMDFFVAQTARAVERAAGAVPDNATVHGTSPVPAHIKATEAPDPANFLPCFSSYPFLAERRIHVLQAIATGGRVITTLLQNDMHDELYGFSDEPPPGETWSLHDSHSNVGYYRRVLAGDAQGFVRQYLEMAYPGSIGVGMGSAVGSVEMPVVFDPAVPVSHTPLFHTVNANPGGPTTEVPGKYPTQGSPDPSHPERVAYGDCGRSAYQPPPVAPATTDQATRAAMIGSFLTDDAQHALAGAAFSTDGSVGYSSTPDFFVPLTNNGLFLLAGNIALFPDRPIWIGAGSTGVPAPPLVQNGDGIGTRVSRAVIGDSEFISLPGESFPQTVIRGHLGPEQMAFPDQPITPWISAQMSGSHRFFVGLGEDMIGYIMPPGNFVGDNMCQVNVCAANATQDPWRSWEMTAGHGGNDRFGEHHSDDSESVGPTAATLVGDAQSALIGVRTDPSAQQLNGRFINPDGNLDRVPLSNPVGVWVLPAGATEFTPGTGTVYLFAGRALPAACTARGVTPSGSPASWMDFLGKPQATSDESTAGVISGDGRRVYTDVYADLGGGQPPVSGITVPGALPGTCGTPITPATSLPNTAPAGVPAAAAAGVLLGLGIGLAAFVAVQGWRRRRLELE
jgi:hypothetical protein